MLKAPSLASSKSGSSIGSKGGGKAAQAQGSGPDTDGLPKAVEVAKSIAAEALA